MRVYGKGDLLSGTGLGALELKSYILLGDFYLGFILSIGNTGVSRFISL